ncbi:MAG: hypothetical protein AAGU27_22140 [Dehalobacterium sp.]
MYRKRNRKQISLVEGFFLPFGGELDNSKAGGRFCCFHAFLHGF